MARSSDPRKPTEFQRGSKRYHSVGGHVPPGDEVENTRDHERIWFELRRHRSCCCEPDSAGFRYCVGEIADYPTTICGEHLIPSNSLIDYYPGDGYNGGGAGYWALYNGCGAGEADSEPFGFALFYPDGSWRNGPIFTSQSKPLDFLGTGVGWNREFWLPNVTWSFEYWIKPSPTDIASGTQLSAAGSFMNVNDGGIFTFLRTGGGIGFEHAETGVVQSAAGVITADKWHHIVYVRDATAQSFSIYVNGIRRVYRTLSNSFGINTDIYFAPFSGSANSQFTDVARYNVALTPLQIYRHYRAMADRYALNPPDGEEPGGDDGTGGGVIEDPAEFIFDLDPSRILGSGTANDVMLSNGDTAYWESPEGSPFELEERKGVADGYAALDSGVLVPASQLGTGPTDTGLRYLRDDRVWAELEEIIPSPTALGQVVRADPSESADFTAALAVVWPTSTYFHYPLTESAAPFAAAGSTFGNLAVTGSAAVVADPDEVFSGETVVKCSGGTDGLASAGSPNADIGRSIIGVWLKVDALPAANVTVVRAGAGNFYALQLRSDGKLDLYVNNLLKLTSTSVIPVGEWTFIVYANDGAGLSTGTKLWINGVLDASGTAVFGSSFVQLVVGGDGIEASFAHLVWVGQEHAGNFLDAEALSLYETRRPVWTLIDEGDLNAGSAAADGRGVTFLVASDVANADVKAAADYVCDGVDDDVEIQAALNALPAWGGKVVLSEGTFFTGATITLPSKFVTLEGQGRVVSEIKLQAAENVDVLVAANQHQTIRSLSVNGNRSNQTTNGHGIKVTNTKVIVEDVWVSSCYENGIYVVGTALTTAHANKIDRCYVTDCRLDGVALGAFAYDAIVTNVWSGSNLQHAFSTASGEQRFIGCHGWGSGVDGLRITASTEITVIGCYFETNGGRGIRASGGSHRVRISGTHFYRNVSQGVYGFQANYWAISGCFFTENGFGTAGVAGIRPDDSDYWTVSGCIFRDSQGTKTQTYAIDDASGSDYTVFLGNIALAADHKTGSVNLSGANRIVQHNQGPSDFPAGGGGSGVEIDKNDVDVTAAARSRLNFVEGSNITITATDDGVNDEVDITIAATAPAGSGIEVSDNGVDVSASPRGRLNFLDGYGTTVVTADDGVNDEVEVSIDLPDATSAAVGDVLTLDAGKDPVWDTPAGGGGLYDAYAYVRDEKASGTVGGTSTGGSWNKRTLNTEVTDPDGIVSLDTVNNQFTLAAGTYRIAARAPAWKSGGDVRHKLRLRNVTDGSTALVGASQYGSNSGSVGSARLVGVITIAASKTFELQHYINNGQANQGLGVEDSSGEVEVYAEVEVWRVA